MLEKIMIKKKKKNNLIAKITKTCASLHTLIFTIYYGYMVYVKCPKISHTAISDKIAHAKSADPDQTHYKNTPIQIYWKLYNQKREIFR